MSMYRSTVNWFIRIILLYLPAGGVTILNGYHWVARTLRRRLTLRRINLAGVPLTKADLADCNLCGSNIRHAYWDAVRCSGTQFNNASFEEGVFDGCDFGRATMTGAKLNGALFVDCAFDGASLRGVEVVNTTFQRCSFRGANFADTMLGDAHFEDCDLDGIRGVTLAPK